MTKTDGPQRIVCLSDETTETFYLLGEEDRIVGVSGFSTRPLEARQKPRISTFKSAKIDSILDLRPDIVIGFSHIQAQIASDLIKAGLTVLVLNHRSVAEIFDMILMLARLVGAEAKGIALVERLREDIRQIGESAARFAHRPRVFFEEWMDPLVSGIRWVQELVETAGGEDILPRLRHERDARQRAVDPAAVAKADPEVVLASWCGKPVKKEIIQSRPGWQAVLAVREGHIYEIKSSAILQPGPAALTEGVRQIHAVLARVANCEPLPGLEPADAIDIGAAAAGGDA